MEKHSHAKVFERLYGVERVIRVILQISELDLDRVIRLMEIRATPCDAGAICGASSPQAAVSRVEKLGHRRGPVRDEFYGNVG